MSTSYLYEKSIDCAMRHITVARENYEMHHGDEFDIDWAMDQFNRALDILEQLRGEPPKSEVDHAD